jgi:hypothetical protein
MSTTIPTEPMFLRELARLPAQEILRLYRTPVLLLPKDLGEKSLDPRAGTVDEEDGTPFMTHRNATSPLLHVAALRDMVAVPLEKSDRNVFAVMVTVGRASNNDIVLGAPSVSKFHGYFTKVGLSWRYHDAGSTNGSKVAGRPLPSRGMAEVGDGCEIAFGPEVRGLFKTPDGLVAALQFLSPLAH